MGKRKKKKPTELKLDDVVKYLGLFIAGFIVTMTVIFCVKGEVPDTLITCVLGGGVFEAAYTMVIKVHKIKKGDDDDVQ